MDTCYHVILTEKMCKGYLVKMGGKIKSWKKRWFVFDRMKRTVSYYVGECLRCLEGTSPASPAPACAQPLAPAWWLDGSRLPCPTCVAPLPLLVPLSAAPQLTPVPSLGQINTRQS